MTEAEFWASVVQSLSDITQALANQADQLTGLAAQNATLLLAIDGLAGLLVIVLLLSVGLLVSRLLGRR